MGLELELGLEMEMGIEMEMATGSSPSFGWMLLEGTVQPMAPENNKVPSTSRSIFVDLIVGSIQSLRNAEGIVGG